MGEALVYNLASPNTSKSFESQTIKALDVDYDSVPFAQITFIDPNEIVTEVPEQSGASACAIREYELTQGVEATSQTGTGVVAAWGEVTNYVGAIPSFAQISKTFVINDGSYQYIMTSWDSGFGANIDHSVDGGAWVPGFSKGVWYQYELNESLRTRIDNNDLSIATVAVPSVTGTFNWSVSSFTDNGDATFDVTFDIDTDLSSYDTYVLGGRASDWVPVIATSLGDPPDDVSNHMGYPFIGSETATGGGCEISATIQCFDTFYPVAVTSFRTTLTNDAFNSDIGYYIGVGSGGLTLESNIPTFKFHGDSIDNNGTNRGRSHVMAAIYKRPTREACVSEYNSDLRVIGRSSSTPDAAYNKFQLRDAGDNLVIQANDGVHTISGVAGTWPIRLVNTLFGFYQEENGWDMNMGDVTNKSSDTLVLEWETVSFDIDDPSPGIFGVTISVSGYTSSLSGVLYLWPSSGSPDGSFPFNEHDLDASGFPGTPDTWNLTNVPSGVYKLRITDGEVDPETPPYVTGNIEELGLITIEKDTEGLCAITYPQDRRNREIQEYL
jgi:hypothetical protein